MDGLNDRGCECFRCVLEESFGDEHEFADGIGPKLAADNVAHPTGPGE